jgi:hypothetical protein
MKQLWHIIRYSYSSAVFERILVPSHKLVVEKFSMLFLVVILVGPVGVDRGSMFLQNFGNHLQDYMTSQPERP